MTAFRFRRPPAPGAQMPRRRLLRLAAGALGVSALGLSTLVTDRSARAADYKALVCVFLYGGNDGTNCLVPRGAADHARYAAVRGALALPRDQLVALNGSAWGLHPALAALRPAWTRGQLAPVLNVGPLVRPLTKADYLALPDGSPWLPDGLFSHAEQQTLWATASGRNTTREGWGGRACEALATASPVISLGGNAPFGIERLRMPLVLPGPGALFGAYGLQPQDLAWEPNRLRVQALQAMLDVRDTHVLSNAYRAQQAEALALSGRLARIVAAQPGGAGSVAAIDEAFAPLIAGGRVQGALAGQLYQTAKLIHAREVVGGSRQVYYAEQGGYDTHQDQIDGSVFGGTHAALLRQLGDALAAFQRAMDALGLAGQVTLFTQSDFGRTFAPNSSRGTDHAWGNHQFVLGGAVRGGQVYGRAPALVLGGDDDVGVQSWELQGRWIPTTSVDQFAATLLRWFGASEAQLDAVLPNLANFGAARSLGFV